jgi:hypothetical protein
LAQRVKIANAVFESLASHRKVLSFEEREKRADEALSGSAKMISAEQFDRETEALLKKLDRQRRKS